MSGIYIILSLKLQVHIKNTSLTKAFSHQLEKLISDKNLTDLWNGSTLTAEPFKFRASNASTVGTDFSCSKSGSKSFASTAVGSHTVNTTGPIVTICGKLVVHAKPA